MRVGRCLTVTGVLAVLRRLVAGAARAPVSTRRVAGLLASSDRASRGLAAVERPADAVGSTDEAAPEPRVRRSPTLGAEPRARAASRRRRSAAPVFADIVLRETVVQAASLVHGVRRALSPETRNRIRFEMRREVKRSRKQRRADLREARREWEARQRAAMATDDARRARRMNRGLWFVAGAGAGDLRDGPRPPCRRGADRRRAARPARGARGRRADVPRRGRRRARPRRKPSCASASASCLMGPEPERRHRRRPSTTEEGSS